LHHIGSQRSFSQPDAGPRIRDGSDREEAPFGCGVQGGSNVTFETSEPNGRSTIAASKSYRCYFTDDNDRIQSYEQIDCPDDAAAALKVEELLATSKYATAELWQGGRLVGRWSVGSADGPKKHSSNGS
jgi:hypothetical protein